MAHAERLQRRIRPVSVRSAAVSAEALVEPFPRLNLPIHPPYPPAEARAVKELPHEPGRLYEPKWDGFRCLAFRKGDEVVLQSKAGQPLGRYFPEVVAALRNLHASTWVLDGEIVIRKGMGLDFDALLQRIHPAASRIQRLAQETPATYIVFDLLVDASGRLLTTAVLSERKLALQKFAERFMTASPVSTRNTSQTYDRAVIELSPASTDLVTAQKWMQEGATKGWDGVIAKRLDCEYTSGERTGMVKVKRIRTADCVIGGFRWGQGAKTKSDKKTLGKEVGSLLLGLYNSRGELDHIGFSSSFTREDRRKLKPILKPFIAGPAQNSGDGVEVKTLGFSGKAPGGPSRWTRKDRITEWVPLKPELVGEFQYDHFSGGRFRHGAKFLRWRPDKKAEQCRMEQLRPRATKK